MKKIGALLIISLLFISAFLIIVQAQNDEAASTSEPQDKAYSCLKNKVEDKCSSLGVEDQAFSLLALSYDSSIKSECKQALNDKSKNNGECWPDTGCRLRDTSLALLALNHINADTDDAEEWLISQTKTPDLDWYLEIDADEKADCVITYSGRDYSIVIDADKKINKGAGSCLTLSQSGYWLAISEDCLKRNFTISCNQDFISTLLYKKPNSDVWHVSSLTHDASAGGETMEILNSSCFEQSNQCNYEGSLWAALALSKAGNDIDEYLPYLIAYAEDNEELSPYTFLYILTHFNDYFDYIITSQNTQGYWSPQGSPYNDLYDTALNILALKITSSGQTETAKTWLLDAQGNDGCWNSIRETAFILYSAFSKPAVLDISENTCVEDNYYCITRGECIEAGGIEKGSYCPNIGEICCDKPALQLSCSSQLGTICQTDENCDGRVVTSSDSGVCCIGTCLAQIQESECEQNTFTCKSLCSDNEETKLYDCPTDEICCGTKTATTKSYWWIWLLIILIILVIIGIIFRDKLRLFIFKMRSNFKTKKGGKPETRPPFPPASAPRGMMSKPVFRMPATQRPVQKRPASNIDRELEDTLKKLREIGR